MAMSELFHSDNSMSMLVGGAVDRELFHDDAVEHGFPEEHLVPVNPEQLLESNAATVKNVGYVGLVATGVGGCRFYAN